MARLSELWEGPGRAVCGVRHPWGTVEGLAKALPEGSVSGWREQAGWGRRSSKEG